MQEEIAATLERNAKEVQFGTVGVELTIHEGKVVKTVYTTAKTTVKKTPKEKLTEEANG